jgi:hypothetical protein
VRKLQTYHDYLSSYLQIQNQFTYISETDPTVLCAKFEATQKGKTRYDNRKFLSWILRFYS